MPKPVKKILISRTDSIGDVVLTLPLVGLLKKQYPEVEMAFLGQSYTRPVANACVFIDEFYDWNEIRTLNKKDQISRFSNIGADVIFHVFPRKEIAQLASKSGIEQRIGTTGRWYHWLTCNRLIRLSRRRSDLHEAQLNLQLARQWNHPSLLPLDVIPDYYGMQRIAPLPAEISERIDPKRFNLILHPKSKGSTREWGLENFAQLTHILPPGQFKIFITGTQAEGDLLREASLFRSAAPVTDMCGRLSLDEMISFIAAADGLIAASTGPLHLAAALGKVALGIYPPIKPMHPGRWAPVGKNASFLVKDKPLCNQCRKSPACECMLQIHPVQVMKKLEVMIQKA